MTYAQRFNAADQWLRAAMECAAEHRIVCYIR